MQCRTKQALRPGAQAKAIWPEIGAAAVLSWRESLCQNQSHVLPSVYLRGLETENPACGQQSGVFAFEGRGFIPFFRRPPLGRRAGFSLLKGEVFFPFIGRHWSVRRVGFRRLRRMALAQPGFVVVPP